MVFNLRQQPFLFHLTRPEKSLNAVTLEEIIKIITSMPSNKEGLDGGLQMSNEINLLGVTLDSKAQI